MIVMPDPIPNPENQIQLADLKLKLANICNIPVLIGHRGANNMDDPLEIANYADHKKMYDELVESANLLAAKIFFLENGLPITEFIAVSLQADTDSSLSQYQTRLINQSYHPSDCLVPFYHYQNDSMSAFIRAVTTPNGKMYMTYRKNGSGEQPRKIVFNPNLKWCQYAKSIFQSEVQHPMIWLEEMKRVRLNIAPGDIAIIEAAQQELRKMFPGWYN